MQFMAGDYAGAALRTPGGEAWKLLHRATAFSAQCDITSTIADCLVFDAGQHEAKRSVRRAGPLVHTLRMIQTMTTITIMVPTTPKPSISFLLLEGR
jgi:hypothetical protein